MKKPIVLVIMDGVGRGDGGPGDAVAQAKTPVLDRLMATCPMTWLKAHGTAVGLPTDDDMGNSEVGHNALGCGQIYSQGAKLVQESIESGALFQSKTWLELVDNAKAGHALHFLGLLSDGNVHSNISHLIAMLKKARELDLPRVYCHILLDGRDVPATSALEYVQQLEDVLAGLNDGTHTYKIASGGGRMVITMDRYEANWPMVEAGWKTHVLGEGRQFASAKDAIETYRAENPGMIDQDLLPFVVAENGQPVGKIANGDSVILFNFRGDRAQEISMAFDGDSSFDKFDRGEMPKVKYAGMLQYDGDLCIPKSFLVNPPEIRNTLTELLVANGVNEFACSETQKFGHVTYFWNGNRSEKFSEELETWVEVPSDVRSFDECPWMKATEITDLVVDAIKSGKYGFIRCNYPNGDMVGHTGNLLATEIAVESVDLCLARVKKACDEYGAILCVTADHGNADQMLEKNKKGKISVRTAHSLNPVPFIVYDKDERHELKDGHGFGLANVAPTVAGLLGIKPFDSWEESMLK